MVDGHLVSIQWRIFEITGSVAWACFNVSDEISWR